MGIVHSSVVDFPPDEVFAWHRRRGAMPRLTPPWAPLRVLTEASSLRDGQAVLGLPGWLRWVAAHQPDGYDPPRRFVDELVSQPLRTVLSWRHSHEFAAEGDSATRVTDRIDTPVPQALLRPMVAYRHPRGDGFLADVVADWESAALAATEDGVRVVTVRTGIVQSPRGGSLRLLFPLFAAGLGGRLGDGEQWLAWIGIDDMIDVYLRALVDPGLVGPVNAVAPRPVRNADYTTALAHVLHRPALLPVPSFGPRLVLGAEGADELAGASQRVVPRRLEQADHRFRHPEVRQALAHVLGRELGAR
ncbi:DUF1731 domain-containing protein [Kutzneria sp. NPDC051319]|uniref:DUF1731 domain-containing protein n=1 Tax=Kutzneria sp. NPDC051319 TaxID=3155047 RepID=UPI003440DD67